MTTLAALKHYAKGPTTALRRVGYKLCDAFSAEGRLDKVLLKVVGPSRLGMLDYLLDRRNKEPWDGPFNGQKARQGLFRHLLRHVDRRRLLKPEPT
jgi:hypothetical protein